MKIDIRQTTRLIFLALLASLVRVQPALSQPAATTPEGPPPRLEATGQFTFLNTQGNASAQSLGAGGTMTWRPDPWKYDAKTIFAQNESDDVLTARSIAASLRASRALTPRWSLYGQYDFLRDEFAGVDQRHVTEGGVSYTAVDANPHRLRLDAGIGYLNEHGTDEDFSSATVSIGAAYRLAISTNSEFTYEPRLLQPLGESGTLRFEHTAALTVALNTILSMKLAHVLRYSADPPPGFEKTDRITSVSLVAKLRRDR